MSDQLTAAVVALILRRLNRTYFFSRQINKQTSKQAIKQTSKQTNIDISDLHVATHQYCSIWFSFGTLWKIDIDIIESLNDGYDWTDMILLAGIASLFSQYGKLCSYYYLVLFQKSIFGKRYLMLVQLL